MQANDVQRFLTNKGWMTINNILVGMPQAAGPREVQQMLKSLTISGKLDVQSGKASGPRMYRLRHTS